MRTYPLLSRTLLLGVLLTVQPATPQSFPTEKQTQSLVSAALRDRSRKMRLIVSSRISRPMMPPREIREAVESIYERTKRTRPRQSETEIQQAIEAEVLRIQKEQHHPTMLRRELFYSDHRFRLDQVASRDGTPPGAGKPYEMIFIITGDPLQSDYTHWKIRADDKIATLDNKKTSMFARDELWEAGGFDFQCRLFIQGAVMNTAQSLMAQKRFEVDPQKIKALSEGTHETYILKVSETRFKNFPVHEFVLFIRNSADFPLLKLICDQEDYARAYRIELRDPLSGLLTIRSERSAFDTSDFPRKWIREEFSNDGSIHSEEHLFEAVDLNPSFSDEKIFNFKVPADWTYVDRRSTIPIATVNGKPVKTLTLSPMEGQGRIPRKPFLVVALFMSLTSFVLLMRHARGTSFDKTGARNDSVTTAATRENESTPR